jgi:hypothetical protein
MNLILMQNSYPPAVIRNEKRQDYYQALMTADEGDLSALVALVAGEVERTIRMMVEIAENPVNCTKENVIQHLSRLDAGLGRTNHTERE